jgi:hypothetical protein
MVDFGYVIVNFQHKGDNKYNNNNNKYQRCEAAILIADRIFQSSFFAPWHYEFGYKCAKGGKKLLHFNHGENRQVNDFFQLPYETFTGISSRFLSDNISAVVHTVWIGLEVEAFSQSSLLHLTPVLIKKKFF